MPGLTDVREGMNGFAIGDLNRDGLPDILATFSPQRTGTAVGQGTNCYVLGSEKGVYASSTTKSTIRDTELTLDRTSDEAQVPNLADFNGDGLPRPLRHAALADQAGVNRQQASNRSATPYL